MANITQKLKILMDSKKTVFRAKDLQSLWDENSRNTIIYAKRMVVKKLILKLDKGYYALNREYSVYELANLIISPSYVSFNSALLFWGVCFQVSDIVQSVSLLNYQKEIENRVYKYQSMKKDLFFNSEGVDLKNNISVASPERALLDSFYFGAVANIDDWEKINKTYLNKLAKNYPLSVQGKIKDLKL
ncbi:hypothetical protein KAS41_02910 [Candidatus Parcubacteria bacterium]|nr:hypothetical protein [Candidatus Parcubacteria bacterium]